MSGAFYSPEPVEPGADWRLLVTDRFIGAFGPATSVSTLSTLWRIAADPALLGLAEEAAADLTRERGAEALAVWPLLPATCPR